MEIDIDEISYWLSELSDRETQEKLWVTGGKEISSFEEAICGLFDDCCVTRALNAGWIAEPLASMLRELDGLIDRVPVHEAPRLVIVHPAMEAVRIKALALLQYLRSEDV